MSANEYEIRKRIAEDIQILRFSCMKADVNKSFIAGLEIASEVATGEITINPHAVKHPTDIPLFDINREV